MQVKEYLFPPPGGNLSETSRRRLRLSPRRDPRVVHVAGVNGELEAPPPSRRYGADWTRRQSPCDPITWTRATAGRCSSVTTTMYAFSIISLLEIAAAFYQRGAADLGGYSAEDARAFPVLILPLDVREGAPRPGRSRFCIPCAPRRRSPCLQARLSARCAIRLRATSLSSGSAPVACAVLAFQAAAALSV